VQLALTKHPDDADKAQMEITPVAGAEIQALVKELYGVPAAVAQKAAALVNAK
jgi:hypothetical protein